MWLASCIGAFLLGLDLGLAVGLGVELISVILRTQLWVFGVQCDHVTDYCCSFITLLSRGSKWWLFFCQLLDKWPRQRVQIRDADSCKWYSSLHQTCHRCIIIIVSVLACHVCLFASVLAAVCWPTSGAPISTKTERTTSAWVSVWPLRWLQFTFQIFTQLLGYYLRHLD